MRRQPKSRQDRCYPPSCLLDFLIFLLLLCCASTGPPCTHPADGDCPPFNRPPLPRLVRRTPLQNEGTVLVRGAPLSTRNWAGFLRPYIFNFCPVVICTPKLFFPSFLPPPMSIEGSLRGSIMDRWPDITLTVFGARRIGR